MVASYDDSIVTAIDLKERKIIKKLEAGCVPHVAAALQLKWTSHSGFRHQLRRLRQNDRQRLGSGQNGSGQTGSCLWRY